MPLTCADVLGIFDITHDEDLGTPSLVVVGILSFVN